MLNFNSRTLDELAARIRKAVEASPARDIEKNVKTLLQNGLLRLDLVTRDEFDTQAQVLGRTREKLEQLEARLSAMEAHAGIASPPNVELPGARAASDGVEPASGSTSGGIPPGAGSHAPPPPMGPAE